MTDSTTRAVVLVSGGLDSATALAIARSRGFDCYALSFDYGQRHRFELQAARRVCAAAGVTRHVVFELDLRAFGGSALTDDIDVPRDRIVPQASSPAPVVAPIAGSLEDRGTSSASEETAPQSIPVTYVPARNTIFLSIAMGWAEALGAADLFIGVNAVDYSGYPDCRPEFIEAFTKLANLATRAGVEGSRQWKIHTPLLSLTKAEIIRRGVELGVDYSLTFSCYDPDSQGRPCGRCDSCGLRLNGFAAAGLSDPLEYSRG